MQAGIPHRHRRLAPVLTLTAVLVPSPLPCQAPAPAGETAARAAWSADDAMVWHVLHECATRLRLDPKAPAAPVVEQVLRGSLFGSSGLGVVYPFDGDGFGEANATVPERGFVVYVWPLPPIASQHVFCLVHDGRLLVAPNTAGYEGSNLPAADAATGAGSRGRPADLLRTPGKGRDGQLWETAAMVATRQLHTELRDDQGAPVQGRVALVPRGLLSRNRQIWLPEGPDRVHEIAAALPAGQTGTGPDGTTMLTGVAARGLVACAGEKDGLLVALAEPLVRVDDGRLLLTLPRTMLQAAQLNRNESAAVATLKNISSAQAQCQASAVIDANQNGAGEYGYFGELSGASPVRGDASGGVGKQVINPPVLSRAFAKVEGACVERSGYVFQIWLPSKAMTAVAENQGGGGAGCEVDAARAEVIWCCYAWPIEAGVTGQRAFFVNQAGDVLACRNKGGVYSGKARAPLPTAAFAAGDQGNMDGKLAANGDGKDGLRWVVVN